MSLFPLPATMIDYHTHQFNPNGGYLCAAHRQEWLSISETQGMIPCFGIHPQHIQEISPDALKADLEEYIIRYPYAQVGESGLDATTPYKATLDRQQTFLDIHADVAWRHNRLLQLHGAKAWGKILQWARKRQRTLPALHLHAWNGSPELAQEFLKLGATFSAGVREWQSPRAPQRYNALPVDKFFPESDDTPASWSSARQKWEEWQMHSSHPR